MADRNEGVPIFVDVGTQDQFPMPPGPYAVYSHNMSKHLEQNVKQERMEEGMLIAPDGPVDQSLTMDYDCPITEKQEENTKPETVVSLNNQPGMAESQTNKLGKHIKCTEVVNGTPCKIRRVSLTQLEVLWQLLNTNKEIVSAYNRSLQDKEHAKKKWTEMTQMLNSIDRGVRKDWRGWSKYWVDFKAKLKRRMAAIKASQTGAGPPEPPLTDLELKFSRLLNKKPNVGENSGGGLIRPGIIVEPLIPELIKPSIKEERVIEQVEMVQIEVKIEPENSPSPPPLDQPQFADATRLRNSQNYPNHIHSLPIPSSSVDDTQNETQNSRKRTRSPSPNDNSPPSANDASPPSANDSCPSSPDSNYCPSSPNGNDSSPNPNPLTPTPAAAEEKSPPKRRRRAKVARMTHDMARRALVESSRIQSDAALRSCEALERIAQNTHDILIQLRRNANGVRPRADEQGNP